jgi:hypothetical protein
MGFALYVDVETTSKALAQLKFEMSTNDRYDD